MLATNCGKRDRSRSHLQASIQLGRAVAEARRVQQQVLDGDVARRLASRARAALLHHHVLELGQKLRRRIGEAELVLLDEHHDGDSGHGLGHRVDAEERPLGHRRLRFEALQPDRLEVDELAAPRDGGDGPGDLPIGHELPQQRRGQLAAARADMPAASGVARGMGRRAPRSTDSASAIMRSRRSSRERIDGEYAWVATCL